MCHKSTLSTVLSNDRKEIEDIVNEDAVTRVLVVGGGYAGFYTAWRL
jgi:NADPH-dependent 2,4-dienoyl-CoA reductase/sulfur reductase-like enzyme